LTLPLVSGVLIVVLAGLGLVIVQFLTKRVRRIIRSVETIHQERRQQTDTIVHSLWREGITLPYGRRCGFAGQARVDSRRKWGIITI